MAALAKLVKVKTSDRAGAEKQAIMAEVKSDLAEWLTAKEDPFWRPPIEITERHGDFTVKAPIAAAGLEYLEVMVAPEMMLINGRVCNPKPKGVTVHRCELPHGKRLRRVVEFPKAVNPGNVHAEIRDGVLSVTAEIADARRQMVPMLRAA